MLFLEAIFFSIVFFLKKKILMNFGVFFPLQFKYINSEFTTFELWFRLFFLILTSLAGMVFTNQLKGVRPTDWAIEQKYAVVFKNNQIV